MSAHPSTPSSPWLAFATQAEHAEAFWRCLPALRRRGMDAALYSGQMGDAPPWSVLMQKGRWQGLLLSAHDPMSWQWQDSARQKGIAVGWMPDFQEA